MEPTPVVRRLVLGAADVSGTIFTAVVAASSADSVGGTLTSLLMVKDGYLGGEGCGGVDNEEPSVVVQTTAGHTVTCCARRIERRRRRYQRVATTTPRPLE
jgi:hypothetical protein